MDRQQMMASRAFPLWAAMLAALFAACGKRGGGMAPYAGCGKVEGIHMTDHNGMHFGDMDATDWAWHDEWCPLVEALFPARPVQYAASVPDSLVIACYPNPARIGNVFSIGFYYGGITYADFRFVDAGFNLLAAHDSVPGHAAYFGVNGLGISQPQVVRAYYRAVRADGTAFRGHGDLQVVP